MFSKKSLLFCVCAMAMTSVLGCGDNNENDENGKNPDQVVPGENQNLANTCTNKVKDGTETDVDCGGECGGCDAGKACVVSTDCATDAACVAGKCVKDTCTGSNCSRLDLDESCFDGVKNNDETDVDCGGSCDKCQVNEQCQKDSDCASSVCGVDLRCEGNQYLDEIGKYSK